MREYTDLGVALASLATTEANVAVGTAAVVGASTRLGEAGHRRMAVPPPLMLQPPRPAVSHGACPCCIAALVAEAANYKSLQETLANTELPCFRRLQP